MDNVSTTPERLDPDMTTTKVTPIRTTNPNARPSYIVTNDRDVFLGVVRQANNGTFVAVLTDEITGVGDVTVAYGCTSVDVAAGALAAANVVA